MTTQRCIVLGAGGRDFHDLLTFFATHPEMKVVCFTAAQIPFIEKRVFPRELAPAGYDADIPIHLEAELPELVKRYDAEWVFLAYSDLSHEDVMHKASIALATGASFGLLGPRHTELVSKKPVVSVTAVRTGAGKSPVSQAVAAHLASRGLKPALLRHPMPYGDLARQKVQRFKTIADLDAHQCTLEEREEYEPHLERGTVVWAGVDYRAVLAAAEAEHEVVLWDGGNNDLPFLRSDLRIVVADPLRAGHEVSYHPGEANFRFADVIVVSKVNAATPEGLARVKASIAACNPKATVVECDLDVLAEGEEQLRGKRVVVIEDGPTLTHGGMATGAGILVARRAGAEIVDPRPHAVGTIAKAYADYPHLGPLLPALGYSDEQRAELVETIRRAAPDLLVDASPARVARVLGVKTPTVAVRYAFAQRSGPALLGLVDAAIDRARAGKK